MVICMLLLERHECQGWNKNNHKQGRGKLIIISQAKVLVSLNTRITEHPVSYLVIV